MKPLTLFFVIAAAIVAGLFGFLILAGMFTQPMSPRAKTYAEEVKARQDARIKELDRRLKMYEEAK